MGGVLISQIFAHFPLRDTYAPDNIGIYCTVDFSRQSFAICLQNLCGISEFITIYVCC